MCPFSQLLIVTSGGDTPLVRDGGGTTRSRCCGHFSGSFSSIIGSDRCVGDGDTGKPGMNNN